MQRQANVTERRRNIITPGGDEIRQQVVSEDVGTSGERAYSLASRIVYYVLAVLEVLFLFRLAFKILGANPNSGFVAFIYGVTAPFVAPFAGIFPAPSTEGTVTTAFFDSATLVAMIIYGLIAWGLAYLLALLFAQRSPDEVAE